MNQEPFALNLFRALLWLGLLVVLAMIYWSSTLVEYDLKYIKENLKKIESELLDVAKAIQKINGNSGNKKATPLKEQENQQYLNSKKKPSENLLTLDPFYAEILPKLLPANFKPNGIRREASIGRPANLHPFSNWVHVNDWISSCSVTLATLEMGKYETLAPELAVSMELKYTPEGAPEFWVALRQDVYWAPLNPLHFTRDIKLAPFFLKKHPVTAHDVKFYFDAIMNRHVEEGQAVAMRVYYSDIEEVRVVDDYTIVVRWKTVVAKDENGEETLKMKYLAKSLTGSLKPLARFVYQYFPDGTKIIEDDRDSNTYRTNPIWAQNFAHHWANNIIVSCGPWLFDGMTEREIRFRRNPDFFNQNAILVKDLEVKFKDSPDNIWEDFKLGSFDLFPMTPNLMAELEQFLQSNVYQRQKATGLGIKRLDYISRSYNYVGWNQVRLFFRSRKVRQALTLAIDRERIIRQNLNGMGIQITSPFFPYSPAYNQNIKPYPFNLDKARQLLREEGWYDSDGDGIIDKMVNGERLPFRFTLVYFVKNPTTKAICNYIATTLKEVGIECVPNGVDLADLSAIFEDKNFDALCMGWALGTPPEDPKQLWYSKEAKARGSSNMIGFVNAEADDIIEKLNYEYNQEKRIELYHRFCEIIHEEAPYTFLYCPKVALVYREYLQNVFIPAERQDLIPGANMGEPIPSLFWIKNTNKQYTETHSKFGFGQRESSRDSINASHLIFLNIR